MLLEAISVTPMLRSKLPTDNAAPETRESSDGAISRGVLLGREVLRMAEFLSLGSEAAAGSYATTSPYSWLPRHEALGGLES